MKKVSTYLVIGIELFGIYMFTQHRYMYFRAADFLLMCLVAIVYIVCEAFIICTEMNCISDVECSYNDEKNKECVTFKDLENIVECIDELENKTHE